MQAQLTSAAKREYETILAMSGVVALKAIFEEEGFALRVVGGVVRDLLRGISPKDIDMATTARPEVMIEFLLKRGIRVVETGMQHGTITAVIDKVEYEITTLRIDSDSDGRHCTVVYTQDWKQDALRRDLTINAMSMDLEGNLYDYYNGREHLQDKQIFFVGEAGQRIDEDYLRILRYFRFHGRISCDGEAHDAACLLAITERAEGLAGISGERIRAELMKIMTGANATSLLRIMEQCTVTAHIGLNCSEPRLDEFARLSEHTTNGITRMVGLIETLEEWEVLHKHWRLHNPERDLGNYLIMMREGEPLSLESLQDELVDGKKQQHVLELACYQGRPELAAQLLVWDVAVFPVNGKDLKTAGMKPGKHMGAAIAKARGAWKVSRYTLPQEECLKIAMAEAP